MTWLRRGGVREARSWQPQLQLICLTLLIWSGGGLISLRGGLGGGVSAAVLGVDYGSEWLKVAVVNPKPGQSPISIVINEMSKRKSPALVAFSSGDRLLGEEAAGLIARYPDRVYARLRDVAGKPVTAAKELFKAGYLPYNLEEEGQGSARVRIRTHDAKASYSAEELVAMVLSYARALGEAHVKSTVKDVVVTVPPFFGQSQRQAILDAGHVAGIKIMALIGEHAAVALQYGIDKDFANGSRDVLFYDMGANSVHAAIVHYSAYTVKEKGKDSTYNQFHVKGLRWDANLGGQTMEGRLVEHFADEFNKKVGGGVDVRTSPKAMAKLKKEVKRTKEILSANTEASVFMEALHNDIDFRTSITREKFEGLCADLWERALVPARQVLKDANLSAQDLHAVEVIGGATRVPKLQAVLSEFLDGRPLDKHLDADEAMALGAALQAANLSDGFKLNRKLGMVDGTPYGTIFTVEDLDGNPESMTQQTLIHRLKKLPYKVIRSLKSQTKDFKLVAKYDPSEELPPGIPDENILSFEVTGLADVMSKYGENASSPIKTNIHFTLSRSGVLSLDKVEAVVEVQEWIEVPVKNVTENGATAANETEASSKSTYAESGEGGQASSETTEGGSEGEAGTTDEGSAPVAAEAPIVADGQPAEEKKVEMKRKLRKRIFRIPLKIVDVAAGYARPMSEREVSDALRRMEVLQLKDEERKRTAEAKNSLESYIYDTKDKLDSLEGMTTVTTEEQREQFRAELSEAEDWLYLDGENAPAADFKRRLSALKKTGDLIFGRLTELSLRPTAVDHGRSMASESRQVVESWSESKPWINETDKQPLLMEIKAYEDWLNEKVEEQNRTPLHLDPVFSSADVVQKIYAIREKVNRVGRTPKPRPKPAPKVESKTVESEGSSEGGASEDSGEASEGGQPEPAGEDIPRTSANESQENAQRTGSHDEL
ncbi:hypothetical protein CBR_g51500 [Chara braunii]|uniref:Heat shock 70 kDa protein 17 n=1 Tax=Chara braunii TaxID=69332 RepID=A0A388K6E9_CHABU|nr:hypothetical protein CBR_g51500 [Chara braunii]|eukprot:GBG65617.1 hypothetical protein CBR_g51500 [Chara braunii]